MRGSLRRFCLIATALLPLSAWAGTAVPFTINLSKAVNVVTSGGTPRIAVDVAGTTRYANYTSGSGTSALVFTYQMQAGDVDLDGVAVSSPVQLNGGTIKDLSGNPLTNLTFTPPNTAGIKVNYPSLGMDFTNGAGGRYTLNGTPYTTLASFLSAAGGSFTRASVGTYYDSAGVLQTASANTPRLDYDPVTHAAKGILIEEARTNLLTRSSEFENAAWPAVGVSVTPNTTSAPDGTNTADTATITAGGHYLRQFMTVFPSTPYTFSFWAKRGTATDVAYSVYCVTSPSNIVVPTSYYSQINAATWTRVSIPFTTPAGCTSAAVYPLRDGASSGTAYIWGAQLEQGAFPTSYIPTTTAAVTRAADSFYVGTTATPQGTFFADYMPFTAPSTHTVMAYTNSVGAYSAGYGQLLRINGSTITMGGNCCGVNTGGGAPANSVTKMAGSYNTIGNRVAVSANGSAVGVDTNNDFTTVGTARLHLGALNAAGGQQSNGYIRKAKVYSTMVPDAQLQLMTQ